MTTSMRMEKDQSQMTEGILNLTMEIIYLLTGESFSAVKSGDPVTITVPPPQSLKLKKKSWKKILEVTKKMIKLLTGEDSGAGNSGRLSSKGKLEYLEGHKKVMKDKQTLTSPDGSSNRNPPERCARPLYSRDSTQEDLTIPHHHQSGNIADYNIIIKEENIDEDEEYGATEELSDEHNDLMEPPRTRNPPERCQRPLYSRDSKQKGHTSPHHHKGEDVMEIKVEGEVEETYVRDDQQYMEEEEEAGMMTSIEEDTPTEISTGHSIKKPSKDNLALSPSCKTEDENITGEKTVISSMDSGDHNVNRPCDPSDSEQPHAIRDGAGTQEEKKFPCPECWRSFRSDLSLTIHLRTHTGEKLHPCCECGKNFLYKSELFMHYRSHTGEKPYSCPECGKTFSLKTSLSKHQRLHVGERIYSCPDCEKVYKCKSDLVIHRRSHTGEKPFSCLECGKSYPRKSTLIRHQMSHTGEKPYSCPECGKCFSQKAIVNRHLRAHKGEKPFPCSECGKCYPQKSTLIRHQRSHTGEKPFSCSECGKCFTQKVHLTEHQSRHAHDKQFSCPECGKCFPQKSLLTKHRRSHATLKV
ncbi:uncharacterized protein ACMZJ9_014508 [Mantella aurantiaca]